MTLKISPLKQPGLNFSLPLFNHPVSAGFASPADDYIETPLDLNEHLIARKASTFFVRVTGESMIGAGIFNGDLLIVDRSLTAKNRDVVLAVLDGALTLKRFIKNQKGVFLHPENPLFKTMPIADDADFQIWGVAIYNIHALR